jgi:acyl-CoA synthetase (AMP-forming)/AMP-acid ligase II
MRRYLTFSLEHAETKLLLTDSEYAPGIADERQPIFLMCTSGTTGDPKGVVSNAHQVDLNSLGLTTMWALPRHPRYLWTLPMFHAMG